MKYLLSGLDQDFLRTLSSRSCNSSDMCFFYDEPLSLVSAVLEDGLVKKSEQCLMILDYDLYGQFKKCFYRLLFDAGFKIPIVIFNAPGVDPSCRMLRWLSENEIEYECLDFGSFVPIFEKLDFILSEMERHREKGACEKSASCNPHKKTGGLKSGNSLYSLPPSMKNLYSFLFDNAHREISIDEIAQKLEITAQKKIQRNNLAYAYIARLRKYLADGSVRIVRAKKGFYRLVLS